MKLAILNNRNYKQNNLKKIWYLANLPQMYALFNFNIIKFLKNFKFGEKIFYKLMKLRFLFKQKPIIPFLSFFITTRCTLRCKHCNTFIPYYRNKFHQKNYTLEMFKKDLDILLDAVDYINIFQFIGGEPLLNKDLPEMIEYACTKSKINNIFLTTNATILPSSKLIKVLKYNRISVQVSDYRNTKYKNIFYKELQEIFAKENIKCNFFQESIGSSNWSSNQEIYWKDTDIQTLKKRYNNCFNANCISICDGKWIQCIAGLFMFRNLKLEKGVSDEVIDIRTCNNLTEKLIEFYAKDYSKFCNYCHFENRVFNLPCGEQLEQNDTSNIIPLALYKDTPQTLVAVERERERERERE